MRHHTKLLPNTESQLYVSANNSLLDIAGIANIPLLLGTKTMNVRFLVMKSLSQDAILGSEFLSSASAIINFDTNTISLLRGTVVLPLLTSLDDARVVRTLTRVRIKAHCEAIIPVQLPDLKQSLAITESLPNLRNRGLGVAAVLVDGKCRNTMIRVINVSESPIFLKTRKAVAYLTLIQPSSAGIRLTDMSPMFESVKADMSNDKDKNVNHVNSLPTEPTQNPQRSPWQTADRFVQGPRVCTINSAVIPPTPRSCSTASGERSSDTARSTNRHARPQATGTPFIKPRWSTTACSELAGTTGSPPLATAGPYTNTAAGSSSNQRDEHTTGQAKTEMPTHDERMRILTNMGVKIGKDTLNAEQAERLSSLLYSYRDVMATELTDIPEMRTEPHRIPLFDERPHVQQRYRYNATKEQQLDDLCSKMEEAGIIEESDSVWNSPVLLLTKTDGTARFVVDYRGLNAKTKPLFCALPRFEDTLDKIATEKPRIFSSIDLRQGYFSVGLQEESRPYTAFSSKSRHFHFRRLPQGYINSGAAFTYSLSRIFAKELRSNLCLYVDDLLTFHNDINAHLDFLAVLFEKFREFNIRVHPGKLHLATSSTSYLGFSLDQNGYGIDHSRCKVVKDFPRPKTVKEVKSYLGLTQYYRKTIQNFSLRSAPLRELLRKNVSFHWGSEQENSFTDLRDAICSPNTMHYPNQDLPFRISLDASKHAVSYVLYNLDDQGNELPVFFGGRSTNANERKFSATDLELSALLAAVKAYEPYISGSEFQVKTHHLSLVYLNTLKFGNSRLVRASLLLSQYKFKILHTPGRTNQVADALSRVKGLKADALTAYQQSRHCANDQIDLALDDNANIDIGIQCDLTDCKSYLVFQQSASHEKPTASAPDRQTHADTERLATCIRQTPTMHGRQVAPPHHIGSVTSNTAQPCARLVKQRKPARQRGDTNNNNDTHTETGSSTALIASHADSSNKARRTQATSTESRQPHPPQGTNAGQPTHHAVERTDSDAQRTNAELHLDTANTAESFHTVHTTGDASQLQQLVNYLQQAQPDMTEDGVQLFNVEAAQNSRQTVIMTKRSHTAAESKAQPNYSDTAHVTTTDTNTTFAAHSDSDQQPVTPGERQHNATQTDDLRNTPNPNPNASVLAVQKSSSVNSTAATTDDSDNQTDDGQTTDKRLSPADDDSEPLDLQTQATDDELAPIIWYLKEGTLPKDNEAARKVILKSENFFIKNNQLFFVRQKRQKNNPTTQPISEVICIPKKMQPLVLARYHAELIHIGAEKLWLTLRDRVYWRSLYTDVRNYVAQCTVCKQGKAETHPLQPTLQSRQVPDEIFNTLHVDHIKVPKRAKNQKFGYILVLLDALSLNCELVPTVGTTAQETCDAIVTHWICRYGTFKYLISDRHPAFVSNLTQMLLQAAGVKHIKVAAYHSKGNAACERMNGIILQGLRTYGRNNADWHTALPMIAAGYRASVNPSRGYSPFELMYGQRARLPIESLLSNTLPAHERLSTNAEKLANKLGLMRKSAKAAAQASREKATARINKSRNATQLDVGQRVYLRREKVGAQEDHKTAPLFSGPYIITERLAKNVYKLNHLYTGRPVKGPIHAERLRTCTEVRAKRKPHRMITLIRNNTANKLRRHIPYSAG